MAIALPYSLSPFHSSSSAASHIRFASPISPYAFPNNPILNLKPYARKKLTVLAAKSDDNGEGEDSPVPSWARPGSEELPPWARQEAQGDTGASSGLAVPFYVYLLASTVTAIAAVGSIFEYVNQRPVFGVLNSDSVFYAPLLGFFVFIGFPSSAFLWFKSVQVANKEADEQDRRDGFL